MNFGAILVLSSLFSFSVFAVEPTNNEVLTSVLSQIKQNYDLECVEGREPGTILNPMICNPPICQGFLKFRCYNKANEKKFQVKATYVYGPTKTVLRKVTISILE
jgi:hypothetical protein